MKTPRIDAERIFRAALAGCDPAAAVARRADDIRELYARGGFRRLLVVGFGKAGCTMARAVEEHLGDLLAAGIVIVPHGGGFPLSSRFRVREGGHPVPDAAGEEATREVMALCAGAGEEDLVLVLVSGGGSALLVAPDSGLTLFDKRETTTLLLVAGADIGEVNTVRKHLSQVKGGRLAALAHPATVVSLILSDVIGDPLETIASGPTAPDPTTFAAALSVLARYRLADRVPAPVLARLQSGARGEIPETVGPGDPLLARVTNRIVGSNRLALAQAAREARRRGYRVEILSASLAGEARVAGRWLADEAVARDARKEGRPFCLLCGGETTVTVTGRGSGGRNQELALAFALAIAGRPGITLLSAGTDGRDGPTDAAGAFADGTTVARVRAGGREPAEFLADNDSHTFFRLLGDLFVTGPTGTNVMDLQVLLVP